MAKKFTEEEYQKIVDCFDEENKEYNMGVMNPNLLIKVQDELFGEFDFINDWEEIFAIANPLTREWAHEQFVGEEKKYRWRNKKNDEDGDSVYITMDEYGVVTLNSFTRPDIENVPVFTEAEIREWGYNPDMYDKEEVE